jgi:hypothetical protein
MWWPGKLARETARPGLELEAAGDRVRSYARGSSALDENAGIAKGGEDRPPAFGGTRI